MILFLAAVVLVLKWLGDDGVSIEGEIVVMDKTGTISTTDGFKEYVSPSYDWRVIQESELAGKLSSLN